MGSPVACYRRARHPKRGLKGLPLRRGHRLGWRLRRSTPSPLYGCVGERSHFEIICLKLKRAFALTQLVPAASFLTSSAGVRR